MRVSIAMATYNGAKYLHEQLDSFLYQTRKPDELVACDDGSSDATIEILEAFQAQAPFEVRIVRNDSNLGYAKNFAKALSLCTGDLIFLSDQDDVWLGHKLERVLKEFQMNSAAWMILNNAEITDAGLKPTGLTVGGQLNSAGLDIEHLLLGCCIAFRSEMKPLIFPVPQQLHGHDGWINALGTALNSRVYLPEVLQFYRRHNANTSDWPTTRTTPATRWRVLREKIRWSSMRRDPRAASAKRLEQLDILNDRIKTHQEYLRDHLPDANRLPLVMKKLDEERRANVKRLALQQQPIIARLLLGIQLYFSGGYNKFEGWKSLARDIIR